MLENVDFSPGKMYENNFWYIDPDRPLVAQRTWLCTDMLYVKFPGGWYIDVGYYSTAYGGPPDPETERAVMLPFHVTIIRDLPGKTKGNFYNPWSRVLVRDIRDVEWAVRAAVDLVRSRLGRADDLQE